MNAWLLLALAIVAKVVGTSALKACEDFTWLVPSVLAAVGMGLIVAGVVVRQVFSVSAKP